MTDSVITFGANLAHDGTAPEKTVQIALDRLGALPCLNVVAVSRMFRSPAFPRESGPDFVNGAVRVDARLPAGELLAALHRIEDDLGRRRDRRWGPRTIDLDLVAMADFVLPDRRTEAMWRTMDPVEAAARWPDRLILPHPRMAERAFVLQPMADVWPDWRHPATGRSVAEMLEALDAAERDAVVPLDGGDA